MKFHHSRREFLQKATTLLAATQATPQLLGSRIAASPDAASWARVFVVTQPPASDRNPRSYAWLYIEEVLRRAGVFFDTLHPNAIETVFRVPGAVVILAGNLDLNARAREALREWVKGGGALLGIGGASGLNEVFGVAGEKSLSEGWIRIGSNSHPVTAGLRSSLHVFGGFAVTKKDGAAALAELEGGGPFTKGSLILENRFGAGRALLFSPDLLFSIVHIQQGMPVLQDGKAAPDGLAAINDNVLKAEDGLVLDWQKDRVPAQPNQDLIFLEPIADELRELILRGIFHLAREQGRSLPLLWYWPRGLKAVAHMSHDSDGNDPGKGRSLLKVMRRSGVKSTWCMLYPGGYPKEFYRELAREEFEIALHYDAMTGAPQTSWSRGNFMMQKEWLMKEAGIDRISTNKNHYTRWEGKLDLLRWCEAAGIQVDQTRGPSKKGTIGFPLGGSQPYFPLDNEAAKIRFLRVLEINLLSQDLVVTCPPEYGAQLIDSALRHHGVAHLLFHPAHIEKPGVAESLLAAVEHARARGMEWWTARRIYEWETARRSVQVRWRQNRLELHADKTLEDATLLFLRPSDQDQSFQVNSSQANVEWELHGFQFAASMPTKLTGVTKIV